MAGNSFGTTLRLTTFGESHGPAVGGILDGFPPGIPVDTTQITREMELRRPGKNPDISSERDEEDQVIFLSGLSEKMVSLGTPIAFIIHNKDKKGQDYDNLKDIFRPGHADYTYQAKYGIREHKGGGRSSARETACRVAAGALAKQLLSRKGVNIQAFVSAAGGISIPEGANLDFNYENPVRCPHPETAEQIRDLITQVKAEGDSIGGVISCIIKGCPAGWGEPVFDKIHADLGKAVLSINACKGFEIGSGFKAADMRGSEHNDAFIREAGEKITTASNHSGGVLGGITNGMDIHFKAAFKPTSTISLSQETVNLKGETVKLEATGRHDPCIVPRAVAIVEAMAALVLADHYLRNKSISSE